MIKAAGKDYEQDELILYKASQILRSEIFDEDQAKFKGNFAESCQNMTPTTLRFVSMILYGLDIKNHEDSSQVTRTISQLLLFNPKKKAQDNKEFRFRHDISREPPVPVYIGLSTHAETRNKSLIEKLYTLGISISYDRVRGIEDILGYNVCEQFRQENIVCLRDLRKNMYVVGALDNIDHDPSSTSAEGTFLGTSISIIQCPTLQNPARNEFLLSNLDVLKE